MSTPREGTNWMDVALVVTEGLSALVAGASYWFDNHATAAYFVGAAIYSRLLRKTP